MDLKTRRTINSKGLAIGINFNDNLVEKIYSEDLPIDHPAFQRYSDLAIDIDIYFDNWLQEKGDNGYSYKGLERRYDRLLHFSSISALKAFFKEAHQEYPRYSFIPVLGKRD